MPATLTEFLAPLRGRTVRDQALAAMYYAGEQEGTTTFTTDQIRALLTRARSPRAAKVDLLTPLTRAAALVDSPGLLGGRKVWCLTDSGRAHVRTLLNLPETTVDAVNDVTSLTALATSISDPDIRSYVSEALACLQFNALRACVVFLWAGAVRTLQHAALAHGAPAINAAIRKHDPKARTIKTMDDFAYVKEAILLLAVQDLGIVDKNQRQQLGEALNLRNHCGHPGKYSPGSRKVGAFIEDVLSIVFSVNPSNPQH